MASKKNLRALATSSYAAFKASPIPRAPRVFSHDSPTYRSSVKNSSKTSVQNCRLHVVTRALATRACHVEQSTTSCCFHPFSLRSWPPSPVDFRTFSKRKTGHTPTPLGPFAKTSCPLNWFGACRDGDDDDDDDAGTWSLANLHQPCHTLVGLWHSLWPNSYDSLSSRCNPFKWKAT